MCASWVVIFDRATTAEINIIFQNMLNPICMSYSPQRHRVINNDFCFRLSHVFNNDVESFANPLPTVVTSVGMHHLSFGRGVHNFTQALRLITAGMFP